MKNLSALAVFLTAVPLASCTEVDLESQSTETRQEILYTWPFTTCPYVTQTSWAMTKWAGECCAELIPTWDKDGAAWFAEYCQTTLGFPEAVPVLCLDDSQYAYPPLFVSDTCEPTPYLANFGRVWCCKPPHEFVK